MPPHHNHDPMVDPSIPSTIPKFRDELPIPEVLEAESQEDGCAYYEVEMKRAKHKFHRDFKETTIFGYNGMYPGPTIEAMKGQAVKVKWINNLPEEHFLPVDKTIHGPIDNPEVRTVVHLHGANVAPDSDGHPNAWFSRNNEFVGPKYTREVYEYPNQQQATTLWYHDHALGLTRLNIYAGLAGFYLLHDFHELGLNLPKGKYDIPLMIQDKTFNSDGSLFYPERGADSPPDINPSIVRRHIGTTMVVNGKVWPYLNVEPRKYRFRILNASNTNGYVFNLSNGQSFWQIGTDGGFIDKPKAVPSFPLDPAERIDVIIDFSQLTPGQTLTLETTEVPPPNGPGPVVMQFKVVPLEGTDHSEIPEKLRPVEKLEISDAIKTRRFVLTQGLDTHDRLMLTLNNKMFHDPATELPEYDSIEIWEFANPVFFPNIPPNVPPNVSHPMHIHLVQFQILDRQLFDVNTLQVEEWIEFGTGIELIGDKLPLDPSEGTLIPGKSVEDGLRVWKDTVRAEPGRVTRVIVHFKNHTGDYVWHCHILEHEDHDMMRPFRVIKKYSD